jgi:flagellar protein FliO/FliZ
MSLRLLAAWLLAGLGASAAFAADDNRVIVPGGSAAVASAAATASSGFGAATTLGLVVLAGAGGWWLWRGRKLPFASREARKLAIEETRSLGSRQYLVVASYEGKKLLLGVCPGRIDLLTPLEVPSPRDSAR